MRDLMKLVGLFGLAGSIAIACSATSSGNVFSDSNGNTGGAGGAGGSGTTSTSSEGPSVGSVGVGVGGSGSTGTGIVCNSQPGDDADMDGFPSPEDCNDCDPNVNPNAVEVIGSDGSGGGGGQPYQPADEDCDMQIDEPPDTCDGALNVADPDPLNAARAVELCKMSAGPDDWGVISAGWVMADGAPAPNNANFHLGHGLLSGFGPNVTPRAGARMLGVSSGTARQPSDPGYQSPSGFDKFYTGNHPQGFPKESPACPGEVTGQPHDPTALEVQIRVPSNALGFSFDFDFYTYEWPSWICSEYNDFFVAILNPIPQGQADGQISFDNAGNPISVNNSLLGVCGCSGGPPCYAGGKTFDCPLGSAELTGTGFDGHAATGWLKTTAPVEPNQIITIRWGAYDSGDGVLDSTGLVDNWQWIAEPGTTVGTAPVEPEEPE